MTLIGMYRFLRMTNLCIHQKLSPEKRIKFHSTYNVSNAEYVRIEVHGDGNLWDSPGIILSDMTLSK